jgi:hypothetical protein
MSDETKTARVTLGVKVTFTFPPSQTPQAIEGWWLDECPEFEEWLECQDKDITLDDIVVDDYHVASPGTVHVYYRIEASYPTRWRKDDVADAIMDATTVLNEPDDWMVGEVKSTGIKFYS